MKYTKLILLIIATTFAIGSVSVQADDLLTLCPKKVQSLRGEHSDQPVSVLAHLEQYQYNDNWDLYKEITPWQSGYRGLFIFNVTNGLDRSAVDALRLDVNYRGEQRSVQAWSWQIRNFRTRKWVNIGDNTSAKNWEWSQLSFDIQGNIKSYINHRNKIKIRYSTTQNIDSSQLDYMAVSLVSNGNNNTSWWKPAPKTTWQWQLTDQIDTSFDVAMYDIDLVDTPQETIDRLHAQGRKVVCYFSAGSWDSRRPDAYRFPRSVKGKKLRGYPNEKWLDIRRIDKLSSIMQVRLDLAVEKNCDGVEPDNIDGYDNSSGFPLTFQDQLRYNIWLAKQAHQRGLSIGLKNDLDQVNQLVSHFDWAINEQCYQYTECYKLKPFIAAGKAVFGVEYNIRPPAFCHKANRARYSWLYKNDDLDAWVQSCHNR